ncbi:MAG: phasin family protein [Alphaproteobacteria bacterium]|nr:phasin family protein [Alphaproteobacteria bacterium]
MATKKLKVIEKAQAEDVARKIWLAGVGAYGRMFAEAGDRVGKAAGSANDLFEQLVARGEALEDVVRDRLEGNEATQKVAGVIGKIQDFRAEQRAALKSRVETVRKAVDGAIAPYNPLALAKQVEELSQRVEALEAKRVGAKRVAAKAAVTKAPRRAVAAARRTKR